MQTMLPLISSSIFKFGPFKFLAQIEESMQQDQPWKWEIPESSRTIKPNIRRQDAYAKVSGLAAFTRDIQLPGMLYAKILTSPYAHARILNMDISAAAALVGVRDILQYQDPDIAKDGGSGIDTSLLFSIPTLSGTGDFYQHPMGVVVVGDNEEVCDSALRLIRIQWEEKPFILDMEESAKVGAPKIMAEVMRTHSTAKEPNIVKTEDKEYGNVTNAFAEADRVIEYTIKRSTNSPAGVEPMACVAQWNDDSLELWIHHQTNPQRDLKPQNTAVPSANETGLPVFPHWSKIKVTFPYQGSWFGGLSWLAYSTLFIRLAAILARRTAGRPVKLLYDESTFYCNGDEAGTYHCKVAAKKDGTITGYHWHMVGLRNPAIDKTYECTKIPNIRGTQIWALTNKGHQACFRHGAASCVPHNVMFDRVASEFGLDPTEVALRNDGCQGYDWDHITQYQKENGFPQRHSLKEVIEKGKNAIDWDRKWHAPGTKKLSNGHMHGMGFASINEWHWGAGFMSSTVPSYACLIFIDGKVTIVGLRCNMGGDSESGYRHCVAAELSMKYDDVLVQTDRSDNSAYSLAQPSGSCGTVNATVQLVCAARELKRKILERAALIMSGVKANYGAIGFTYPEGFPTASDLKKSEQFDIKDSIIYEIANPDNCKPLAEIATGFFNSNPIIVNPDIFCPSRVLPPGIMPNKIFVMSRQAHFIEVEADIETGIVLITNAVCVNDVGHVFNPQGAHGQQYGGAIMGIGKSATEEKIYCPETGVGLNFDHIHYQIGTMNDYPTIQCLLHESHLGFGTYGASGIGENVGSSLAGITSSAIYNAIGKWIIDYPITPDKVLRSLGMI
jgi:CO/xanthine dehydrogenase Mo-binding subunit